MRNKIKWIAGTLLLIATVAYAGQYIDNLLISGNTISAVNTNGGITLTPNGTGDVTVSTGDVDLTSGNVTLAGAATVDGRDVSADGTTLDAVDATGISALTSTEVDQLENIGSSTISAGQWGYLGAMDQSVATTDSVTFVDITNDHLILEEQAAKPGNPSSGWKKFYAKTDGKVYTLDSSGNEIEVGSGAGSGKKNYFDGGDFESGVGLASTFEEATAAYTDGTGGSPTTISVAQNTTTALRDTADLKITKAATDGSQEGVTLLSESLTRADQGRRLWISFEWDGTGSNYTSEDITLNAYDVTNTSIINVYCVVGCDGVNGGLYKQKGKVLAYIADTDSSTTTIRVSLYLESDSATASTYDVYVDDATLSPEGEVPGAIITQKTSYTPTIGGSPTTTSNTAFYWRVGEEMCIEGLYEASAAGSATAATISLPSGYSIDTAKISNSSSAPVFGHAKWFDSGTKNADGNMLYSSTTAVTFSIANSSSSMLASFLASGDHFAYNGCFPIDGWSTDTSMSTTEVNLKGVKMRAKRSADQTGLASAETVVACNATDYDSHSIMNTSTGVATIPKSGYYSLLCSVRKNNYTANELARNLIYQNSTAIAYQFRENSGTVGLVVASTVRYLDKDDTVDCRVDSPADASYDISSDSTNSYFEIVELFDPTIFSVWGETEYLSTELTSSYNTTLADTWTDVTGMTLTATPGTWGLGYDCAMNIDDNSGATNGIFGNLRLATSGGTAINQTVSIVGDSAVPANSSVLASVSRKTEVTITETTTYKMQMRCSDATATGDCYAVGESATGGLTNPDNECKMYARRIK